METRNVKVTLETAQRWYQQCGEFKEMALSAYTEEELMPIRNEWESMFVGKTIGGFCIAQNSEIREYDVLRTLLSDKNIFETKKQAKSALAYAQLTQLMALPEYNGDWVPDWSDDDDKFVIIKYCDRIGSDYYSKTHHFLSFKSEEIRDKFIENNYDLLKEYFELD